MFGDRNLTIFSLTSNKSSFDSNTTLPLPLVQAILFGTLMSVIVIGAVLGNILVVASVASNRKLRTITNFYVVSLAIADLLVAILVMPVAIVVQITGRWWFGVIACDIYVSFDVMLCTASILNLCCISLDRYFAITKPLEYSTKRSKRLAIIMIAITWIMATLITCPPILGWREEDRWENSQECVLTRDPGYVIYSSLGSFYLPLLVMSFVYMRIMIVATRRNKRIVSYRRKFNKYTRRSSAGHGSSNTDRSRNRHRLNGIREGFDETELSCDATVLTEDPVDHCQFAQLSAHAPPSPLSQRQTTAHMDLRTSLKASGIPRQLTIHSETKTQSVKLLTNDLVSNSTAGDMHSVQAFDNGDQRVRRWTRRLKMSVRDRPARTEKEKAVDRASAKENKAAKTLAVVVGGFIVCWMPFFIIYTIEPFCETCRIDHTTFVVCVWLGYFNSMINPFIYAFYNRDFRSTFWKLTLGRFEDSSISRNS